MATNVSQIIGASAAKRSGLRVPEMMNVYFVVRAVTVILYPKGGRAKQFIVFDQFHIADGMDLLSSFDDLIGSVRVNVFD